MPSQQVIQPSAPPQTRITPAKPVSAGNGLAIVLALTALGVVAYLPWLGSFGPTDPTDSFFLESGREMVETGKYLLPLNNYEPWLDKPILFFWMVAGAYKLFGVSPFIGRLPAALSAVATGAVIFHSLRGLIPARTAAMAAAIFFCLPLASVVGHVCLTDMTLTLLITGTSLYLFRGLKLKSDKALITGYIFNALGLLCKGPIASILPGTAFLLYLAISTRSAKETGARFCALKPHIGMLIALVINIPWYASAIIATSGKFFETFFLQQNFGRMVGTVNHQMPWWFYIPVFFGGFFPWCLSSISNLAIFKKALGTKDDGDVKTDLFRLVLCWCGLVLILFSAIKTKLPTYILPAAPAFAILVSIQLQGLQDKSSKLIRALTVTVFAAVTLAVCLQSCLPSYLRCIISRNILATVLVFIPLSASVFAAFKNRNTLSLSSLIAGLTIACTVFVPSGLKALHDYRQPGFNQLVLVAKDAGATVGILSAEEPMMPYILHKPVYRIQTEEAAIRFIKADQAPHYLLVPTEMVARLDWFPGGSRLVAKCRKWFLYEVFQAKI